MRHFTTPAQTAKLIGLGFEKPRALVNKYYDFDAEAYAEVKAYSIGELIAILPETIKIFYDLSILRSHNGWWVLYGLIGDGDMWSVEHEVYRNDLVDALYNMIIKLKEDGVI